MLHERDVFKLLGGFIASEVSKQLAPVREAIGELKKDIEVIKSNRARDNSDTCERFARIEKVLGDMPVPLSSAVMQETAERCVDARLAMWPKPKDGVDGKDGKDGENVEMESVWEEIDKAVEQRVTEQLAAWPKPKDGTNGTNGADGESVRLDDVRDWLGALVRQTVAELPVPRHCVGGVINRDGALLLSFSDGEFADLGKVVGANGKDCDFEKVARQVEELVAKIEKPKDGKDGRDGLGFKDMSVTFDGERAFIFKFVLEDRCEELSLTVPFMIYRGVWKQGGYERGDVVTRDGGSFVALADTVTEPGTKGCDWQLCCKRGADGKQGKEGPQGPAGPAGAPAGDLAWPMKGR